MAQKTPSHGVAVSTLFSAMSLLFGTAAYGSFYPGHIDPGGNGLDIPGFTGNAVFNIDSGCVPGGSFTGWLATNANVGSGCGNASMFSATIDLYTVSPLDPPNPGVVTGNFALAEPPGTWPILGVYSLNGALAGVDTDAMGPEAGTGAWSSNTFWLQFVSGFCQIGCTSPGEFGGIGFVDPAFISVDDINNFSPPGTVTFGPACDSPTNCRVVAAPEPGTLALILGALGGGWLARRRKGKLAT